MIRNLIAAVAALALLCASVSADAAGRKPVNCARFHLDANAHEALQEATLPPAEKCVPREVTASDGNTYLLPDPACTPGAINPTVTAEVLRDPKFRTTCVRDGATSAANKRKTYVWYDIKPPKKNTGKNQTCELDHLCSLELGCADTLENIWPQCGPKGVKLNSRYFKIKDKVENYLAREVKAGRMDLSEAQHGVAEDWTQYIDAAAGKLAPK
jgi:hypothetical protein